jgi:hypothetical protein
MFLPENERVKEKEGFEQRRLVVFIYKQRRLVVFIYKQRRLVSSPATVTASAQIYWFCAFEVSPYGQKERRNTVSSAAL